MIQEIEQLTIKDQTVTVEEKLDQSKVDHDLITEIEESSSGVLFYDSEEEMARVYGATQGIRRFSGIVGTIELDDFIIEFGAWCNGQAERRASFNPYSTWQALFQHLEGAPMHDYSEFEARHEAEIEAFRDYWAPDFRNLFGGQMRVGGRRIGGGSLAIGEVKSEGGENSEGERGKTRMGERLQPLFNPILSFFEVLRLNYQGQRLDKMLELQQFQLKEKETYRDAYHRLRRLVECTEGVTPAQAINYWYHILESELKDLVRARVLSLPSNNPPTLEFVFLATDSIAVNLAREKASMPMMGKAPRTLEKGKTTAAHAAEPACSGQKEVSETQPKQPREKFCSGCGASNHPAIKCWILHPELRPANARKPKEETKSDKGKVPKEKDKPSEKKVETSNNDNSAELRFKALESQLALIVAALKGKTPSTSEKKEAPSFYGAWDESFCGMGEPSYTATTRAQVQRELPRGATSTLDPQNGEARQQVRLPESFVLEDLSSKTSRVSQKVAARTSPTKHGIGMSSEDRLAATATTICQTPLFSAQMVGALGLDIAGVLESAAAMCRAEKDQTTAAMKAGALQGDDSEKAESSCDANLYAAAARVQTMPRRPAIERSSVTPGVVVVNNSNGLLQIVGPGGKIFTPQRVLLDSGAQPLMLGKAATDALGLHEGTLEACPFTINTSMGGSERATGITMKPLMIKIRPNDVMDAAAINTKAIVTQAESYDVLVGSTVLYPMGFVLDFWNETASYRPGWQAGDGRQATLPAQFVRGEESHHMTFGMAAGVETTKDIMLDDWHIQHESPRPTNVSSTVREKKKYLATVQQAATLWKSKDDLFSHAGSILDKVWTHTTTSQLDVGGDPTHYFGSQDFNTANCVETYTERNMSARTLWRHRYWFSCCLTSRYQSSHLSLCG